MGRIIIIIFQVKLKESLHTVGSKVWTRARRTTVALARQVQSTLLYVTINGSTFTSTKLSVFKNDIKVSLKN